MLFLIGIRIKRWGYCPQKTIKHAYERRPEAVKVWLDQQYPKIADRAKAEDADRHTMRIYRQVQLCIEPAFVRAISWLPPLAPAECGCTSTWLASIISHS
jgi:Winged helix-turn helix